MYVLIRQAKKHLCFCKMFYSNLYIFTAIEKIRRPVLTYAMSAGQRTVNGVTVLNGEVFAVHYMSPEIEVYDFITLTVKHHISVNGLVDPRDFTSCVKLFIYHGWILSVLDP